MDHLCYLCLVFVMLSHLFIAALWSPAGKGLTSWHLFVMPNCDFVTFPCGILGQVWYLIVMISDLCRHSYFHTVQQSDVKCQRGFHGWSLSMNPEYLYLPFNEQLTLW